MRPRFTYAKNTGRKFYNQVCKNLSYPINLEELVKLLDIGLIDTDIYGEDGFIMYRPDKNKYKIVIDYSITSSRKRFTLAHEIGHIILKHFEQYDINNLTDKEKEVLDKEADVFAGELLMPYAIIKTANASIPSMIKRFNVTPEAMKTRLSFLGISYSEDIGSDYLLLPRYQYIYEDENDLQLTKSHNKWLYDDL